MKDSSPRIARLESAIATLETERRQRADQIHAGYVALQQRAQDPALSPEAREEAQDRLRRVNEILNRAAARKAAAEARP